MPTAPALGDSMVTAHLRRLTLKAGGVMLVGLGILHLAATPLIARLIEHTVPASEVEWFTPPMLLNHVVVGILLFPLGILTYYAAPAAILGERWALVVVRTSAVSVGLLPPTLFLLLGNRYFGAPVFVIATVIVSLAALILLLAAFLPRRSSAV